MAPSGIAVQDAQFANQLSSLGNTNAELEDGIGNELQEQSTLVAQPQQQVESKQVGASPELQFEKNIAGVERRPAMDEYASASFLRTGVVAPQPIATFMQNTQGTLQHETGDCIITGKLLIQNYNLTVSTSFLANGAELELVCAENSEGRQTVVRT